jgi:hypothetical protein
VSEVRCDLVEVAEVDLVVIEAFLVVPEQDRAVTVLARVEADVVAELVAGDREDPWGDVADASGDAREVPVGRRLDTEEGRDAAALLAIVCSNVKTVRTGRPPSCSARNAR